jgi:CMP-N-acetylneuraminic acid synthetase
LLPNTAEQAARAARLDRIVLSTEDDAIAATGVELGLEVPFRRPVELAADDTPMLAVLTHALGALDEDFDAVCLLQPTSPFRAEGLIDRCIERYASPGADAVVTMVPVPPEHHPAWVYLRGEDGRLRLSTGADEPVTRRQDLPEAYHRDGSVYVFGADGIRAGRPYGEHVEAVVLDPSGLVNVDDLDDWDRAEALLAAGGVAHL